MHIRTSLHIVLGTVCALLVAVGCSPSPNEASLIPANPESPTPWQVPLSVSDDTVVEVTDEWTVTVPAAAAPADAILTVTPLNHSDREDIAARAELTLSSGQPRVPLTYTYRFPEPLPPDTRVFVVSHESESPDADDPAAAAVIDATLDADRRIATASVPDLSWKEWITARAEDSFHFLSSAAGLRANAPSCESQPRPAWMTDVTFFDERDSPLRVCTGSDPNNADIAVVKIRNNRGLSLILRAPTDPTWAHLDTFSGVDSGLVRDLISGTLESFGIPGNERSRTWVLPPGGGIDLGFTERSLQSFGGPSMITATVSTQSAVYGLLWTIIDNAFNDPTTTTALELGLMSVCFSGAIGRATTVSDPTEIAFGLAGVARCAAERMPDVLAEVSARLPEQAWQKLVTSGIHKKAARVASRVTGLLAIGEATIVAGDALGTLLALPDSAFQVALWTRIRQTASSVCGGTVKDVREIRHPYLGPLQISLTIGSGTGLNGSGCIVAISDSGEVVTKVDIAIYGDALDFAEPATDATDNVFITYNPGRYDGVVTLVPNRGGFEPIDWDFEPGYIGRAHVYYHAELVGPGADGRYSVRQFANDCTPSCAGGQITEEVLQWDGTEYSN